MTPLTKPDWYALCEDEEMRWYFLNLCRAFSKIPELQEDLYQEAWAQVGQCEDGCCKEYYKRAGYRAMNALYHREYMYAHPEKGDYKRSKDALRMRLRRARKCSETEQSR